MGKWDVNIDDDYEGAREGYSGPVPKRGIYPARLVEFAEHTGNSDTSMKFVFEIDGDEDYDGWRGWVYSDLDNAAWKTEQIVHAITGGKKGIKFNLDPDKAETIVKKAKKVKIRVVNEKYDGEDRGKIRTVLPLGEEASKSKARKRSEDDEDPWEEGDDD